MVEFEPSAWLAGVTAFVMGFLGLVAFGWSDIVAAGAGGVVSLLFFSMRRMMKYRSDQVDEALRVVQKIECELPQLQAAINCPPKVEMLGGTRSVSAPADKDMIEYMANTGHRPTLHRTGEVALEAGLPRLARILGLYHAYLGQEGDRWWRDCWWEGTPCVDYAKLLVYERTIHRVLDDTKANLRGERTRGVYEVHQRELRARPLFQARIRVLGRALRTPQEEWNQRVAPLD